MKKIIILTVLLIAAISVNGQRRGQVIKWISLSAKGGVGNSVLLNTDAVNEQYANLNFLTPSYAYGGRFTFTYGDNIGLGLDLLSVSFGQEYSLVTPDFSYEKKIALRSLDYTVFFRYNGNQGGYFEAGPVFTKLLSAEETNSAEANVPLQDDLMNIYANNYTNIMLGFGMAVMRTERLDLNLGVRLNYGLDDIVPEHSDYILDDGVFQPEIISDKSTNPISAKFLVELNYYFAFWGDASCGQGRLMFFQ
jgi:hypothetical protein